MNMNNIDQINPGLKIAFYSFSLAALSVLFLIYFENILKPFVFALMIWYIIKELKRALGRIKFRGKSMPTWLRGLLAFLIITLIFIGIFQLISMNIEQFNDVAPQYREKIDNLVSKLSTVFNNPKIMDYVRQSVAKINIAGIATNIVNSLSSFFTGFMVVLVYVIFMLLEEAIAHLKVEGLFPGKGKQYQEFKNLVGKIDKSIQAYMFSMLLISFLTAFISYIALVIMGVDFPVLWAFLIFILNFIPYIGPFISSLLPAVLAIFQLGSFLDFLTVFVVLEIIQIILGSFVQPKLMGKSLNISPLTVLIALAFWGSIWGVVGMILSIPIASIAIIIMAQFPGTRFVAVLLSEKGDVGD
ncbi:MAG TPA: AI-2E family transporter [Bacteroidetes bacterium]|nr:AI-2E family transporter [Bacteroidota bacterium]